MKTKGPYPVPGPRLADDLEILYRQYNDRRYVAPDPLQFLYVFSEPADRELVAMLASSLAFGHVKSIVSSVAAALDRLPRPLRAIARWNGLGEYHRAFSCFQYRYVTGVDVGNMLYGVRVVQEEHGSLGACIADTLREGVSLPEALARFGEVIRRASGGGPNYLTPCARKGSACKRLNLLLRWMVRQDAVDPGGWEDIGPERLIIPLDTHMHRIGRRLGFTRRNQADLKTAVEITDGFRRISPDDPVRYDFALTRLAMTSAPRAADG